MSAKIWASVHEREQDFGGLISGAADVRILMRSGYNLIRKYSSAIEDALNHGCGFKVLICKPCNDVEESESPAKMKMYQEFDASILPRLRDFSDRFSGRFETRYLSKQPGHSLIIINRKPGIAEYNCLQIQFYMENWLDLGSDRPVIQLAQNHSAYHSFEQEFDFVWERENARKLQ